MRRHWDGGDLARREQVGKARGEMGRPSRHEKALELRAKMIDPDAWKPPLSREKDERRLAARDRIRKIEASKES